MCFIKPSVFSRSQRLSSLMNVLSIAVALNKSISLTAGCIFFHKSKLLSSSQKALQSPSPDSPFATLPTSPNLSAIVYLHVTVSTMFSWVSLHKLHHLGRTPCPPHLPASPIALLRTEMSIFPSFGSLPQPPPQLSILFPYIRVLTTLFWAYCVTSPPFTYLKMDETLLDSDI